MANRATVSNVRHPFCPLPDVPISRWTERVRAEYVKTPGLALTKWEMRRLWLMDRFVCDVVVDTLVASAFLMERRDGTYVYRLAE
jgi:hypothetical protein